MQKHSAKRWLLVVAAAALALAFAGAAGAANYIVLYKASAVPASASSDVSRAGGSIVAKYGQIGVVIARSTSTTFRAQLMRDTRIGGVSATGRFGIRVEGDPAGDTSSQAGGLPNAPATDGDNLSALQWDMRQIHTPEAHAITGGSPAVIVGDIDTGLDFTHPDLAPNYDAAHSTDCTSGAPQPLTAGNDKNGHGTHTAGTIAAASNGVGIVGVAPNVKIAGIKGGNDDGYFFPEAVICSFVWAGKTHVDVTNNSYFADPYLYNCRNDPVQRAIWKAEQRAIRYAMTQGVTVVAAEGNESDDLAHPQVDLISPDFPPGSEVERAVTNACVVIPVEIPGVVGVTADGNTRQVDGDSDPDDFLKSFYSSYGIGVADVVAPGGDSIFGRTAEAPNGRVLSTWPADVFCRPDRQVVDATVTPSAVYCYAQGTSMASPHVAGVAALIVSRFGSLQSPSNGKMAPGTVQAYLTQTADPQPCPTELPAGYDAFTRPSGDPQTCEGDPDNNSWYGSGQVNALNAVTHTSG